MPGQPVERKLAAIFAADIAGYSRLMARDEVGTLAQLKACRVIMDGLIAAHRRRSWDRDATAGVDPFKIFMTAPRGKPLRPKRTIRSGATGQLTMCA